MEQGPARTRRRGSRPLRMAEISLRVLKMVAEEDSVTGNSSSRKTGGRTTLVHWMRMSSVAWNMALFLAVRVPVPHPGLSNRPGRCDRTPYSESTSLKRNATAPKACPERSRRGGGATSVIVARLPASPGVGFQQERSVKSRKFPGSLREDADHSWESRAC